MEVRIGNFMTIDPGTRVSGWAVFVDGKPKYHGFVKSSKDSWMENVACMLVMLDSVFWTHSNNIIPTVYIELPEYWAGMEGASARESGSISKLYFLCGALKERFNQLDVRFISPSRWKGQLKKEHVRKRVIARIPGLVSVNDHNEMDAIGMGVLYVLKGGHEDGI